MTMTMTIPMCHLMMKVVMIITKRVDVNDNDVLFMPTHLGSFHAAIYSLPLRVMGFRLYSASFGLRGLDGVGVASIDDVTAARIPRQRMVQEPLVFFAPTIPIGASKRL